MEQEEHFSFRRSGLYELGKSQMTREPDQLFIPVTPFREDEDARVDLRTGKHPFWALGERTTRSAQKGCLRAFSPDPIHQNGKAIGGWNCAVSRQWRARLQRCEEERGSYPLKKSAEPDNSALLYPFSSLSVFKASSRNSFAARFASSSVAN